MERTNAKGSQVTVTLMTAVAEKRSQVRTHVYSVVAGQMVCTGCGRNVIDTAYGEHIRQVGRVLLANEIACGVSNT